MNDSRSSIATKTYLRTHRAEQFTCELGVVNPHHSSINANTLGQI